MRWVHEVNKEEEEVEEEEVEEEEKERDGRKARRRMILERCLAGARPLGFMAKVGDVERKERDKQSVCLIADVKV